jgi:hypothetical protein
VTTLADSARPRATDRGLKMSDGSRESPVAPTVETAGPALEYGRRLYANVFDWYKIADSKGQLLMTFNGIFVTIGSGIILGQPREAAERIKQFELTTWLFFSSTALCVLLSIGCATLCLWSRLGDAAVLRLIKKFNVDPGRKETYTPHVAWWFGMIATLEPGNISEVINVADEQFEREALISEIILLSGNVLKKHRWVNRGWVFSAASLVSLVTAIGTYVLTLS